MRDLVERLRERPEHNGMVNHAGELYGIEKTLDALAADEIESLRQQLATAERLLAESQARERALTDGVSGLMDHQYTGTSEAMFYLQNLIDVADELKGGEQ